ncbi:ABC transporter ATP-binding protein [Embleya scabrispora]|uniref:ABC transporter ATP-binding protein n=1 Tax=Embleya scabrispora TaxID=159449 RepID=A0A1T3NS61_9ACTN|nr:ABC transporter ATP-binding protein [Embleya scabrispora]OPC79636.1 ABC transporter ATP-binding protein [Embleya scabrispora]
MNPTVLRIEALTVRYGAVTACAELSLSIRQGEFAVLLGANGAGKTTTLRAVSGLVRPASGRIELDGGDITRATPARRTARGVGHVPEGRRILPEHTVEENLLLGAFARRRDRSGVRASLREMYDLFPRLGERRTQRAGTLSGGEAQALAVARALMSRPRLLMLDEPSLGLDPRRVAEMFEYLARLHREQGLTVLLVEQQARVALAYADRGWVLDRGTVALAGTAAELAADPRVRHAYLGAPASADAV